MTGDIRDSLFSSIRDKQFTAVLRAEGSGCLSGIEQAEKQFKEMGILFQVYKKDGDSVAAEERIGIVTGTPKQIAIAEEKLIAILSKYSGIASAAYKAMGFAAGQVRIACGAWKKMPPEIKDGVRRAVCDGGADFRITSVPMIYLDKNYIRMFGSIKQTLVALQEFAEHLKVVQIRGELGSVEEETQDAVEYGAGILMVDTGDEADLTRCFVALEQMDKRKKVQVAYAGGVVLADIPRYRDMGVDILCIGREIVDAPLLDMKLDVELKNGE